VTTAFPIEHWIVVMMENRSFDHIFGYLNRLNPEIEGLKGDEFNQYNPTDQNSPKEYVNSHSPDVDPNLGHTVDDSTQQIFGIKTPTSDSPALMNGFVANAEFLSAGWGKSVMSSFNETSLPVISTLAMEFTLFDHWHASVPGPTEVNRAYLYSTTSNGLGSNDPDTLSYGLPQKTIMTSLSDKGYSWKVYYQMFPTALFMEELRWFPLQFETTVGFFDDCKNGLLPNFTLVEPRYFGITDILPANDQHPSHDMVEGEKLLKEIYEAVRASPLWNTTALIITYDEHGGYYDHVPTPLNVPNPDGKVSQNPDFDFKRLGIRVPTIVISPWVEKGFVEHKSKGPMSDSEYEHSSVASTLKKVYNLPNLTKRDEWAGTFEHIFLSRSSPRTDCPTTLPEPAKYFAPKPNQLNQEIHEFQKSIIYAANGLNGNRDDISNIKTERQGGLYVQYAMNQFLSRKVVN